MAMQSIQTLYEYPFRGQNQGETWDKDRPMRELAPNESLRNTPAGLVLEVS